MSDEKAPIGVVGVGWVGLVTAACFAELGHHVCARDILPEKVVSLTRGEIPIHEPGLSELVTRNAERLRFTTDMEELLDHARLLFVCVDTPPTYSGDADLSRVRSVVEELRADGDHVLVMKSTVPAGTGRTIRRDLPGVAYVSCPEFLKEGSAVQDFLNPERVVVGCSPEHEEAGDAVSALYEPLGAPIVRTDVSSAEMIKLASNAFLATKISFINEIANVCEEVGADVERVAEGMGLDTRIGPKFLQAGIGFGGSCLRGDETVLVRRFGRTRHIALSELFGAVAAQEGHDPASVTGLRPLGLEVLSWDPDGGPAEFRPVGALTRRHYEGEAVEVSTEMGRTVTCTPDHPFIAASRPDGEAGVVEAGDLTDEHWLPLAIEARTPRVPQRTFNVLAGLEAAELELGEALVRPRREALAGVSAATAAAGGGLGGSQAPMRRWNDVERIGVPVTLPDTPELWRVVGLYCAAGHLAVDGSGHRLCWSFHPTDEMDLVREVAGLWRKIGVEAEVRHLPTSCQVSVSSRILAGWWTRVLGLGRNAYDQRLPRQAFELDEVRARALLSGLWRGEGSWSLVNGGPGVVLEYGTASRELADGVLRLLSGLGIVASQRTGRAAGSTCEVYRIRISGAGQVERLHGAAWVRVRGLRREPFEGDVYSMEVPEAHTFVTSGSLVVHNCFPKDVSALKQLAGNSGYHFQLLTAVVDVNELQKRRVVGKLQKHLDSLVGKRIALLGLAFKPNTDDVREASSLVLASRLQGEGAHVVAYDPVAESRARELLQGTEFARSAMEALDGADAVVLVTEWQEFRDLDWSAAREHMANPLLIDGRNALDLDELGRLGFVCEGIGRSSGRVGEGVRS